MIRIILRSYYSNQSKDQLFVYFSERKNGGMKGKMGHIIKIH